MDPGAYDSSKAKFEDWWIKMKAWLDCNPKQFAYINANGDEIIHGKNYITPSSPAFRAPKEVTL